MDEPTYWVNSLVVRKKPNGSLRICLDPKDLNKENIWEHHPVLTADMVTNRLKGASLFSYLDGKSEYCNVELDEESSMLMTFTPTKVDTGTRKWHMG